MTATIEPNTPQHPMHSNHWQNNQLQFARLISELEQAGAFTSEIMDTLCLEMDLEPQNICEIIERACQEFDEHKRHL